MFLSVIIPVYNVEAYIGKCIESVIRQDLGNKLELILVDDGSKDKSGSICDEYASKYPYIKVHHIQNGGVGNARNFGLAHAKGEYFTFIDSDDFIDDGIYRKAFETRMKDKCDIYVYGYKDYPETNQCGKHILKQRICNNHESLANLSLEMKKDFLMFPVFNKIFNTEKFNKKRFNTKVHYYEDYLFALECLTEATSVGAIESGAYNYVHHPGEHLGGKYTPPEVVMKVAQSIREKSMKLPQNKELTEYITLEYYNNILHAIDSSRSLSEKKKHIRILLSEIDKNGLLDEFKTYLGRRKSLLMFPNTLGVMIMIYLRIFILKTKMICTKITK